MRLIDILRQDEKITKYKREYEEKYKRNPPPFNFDEYRTIEDYREYLRKLVEED